MTKKIIPWVCPSRQRCSGGRGPGCGSGGNETEKANKLVDEGNAAVQEAKKEITDAEQLKQKMLKTDVSHLDDARSTAKEAIAAYEKAEAKCKEAASKYDEASRLKLNDKFKEYLALKVKEYNRAGRVGADGQRRPQALIDSESREGWIKKANSVNEKVTEPGKEAATILGAQADKLQKDNPDIPAHANGGDPMTQAGLAFRVSLTKQIAEWRAELCGPPLRQISIRQPSSDQTDLSTSDFKLRKQLVQLLKVKTVMRLHVTVRSVRPRRFSVVILLVSSVRRPACLPAPLGFRQMVNSLMKSTRFLPKRLSA